MRVFIACYTKIKILVFQWRARKKKCPGKVEKFSVFIQYRQSTSRKALWKPFRLLFTSIRHNNYLASLDDDEPGLSSEFEKKLLNFLFLQSRRWRIFFKKKWLQGHLTHLCLFCRGLYFQTTRQTCTVVGRAVNQSPQTLPMKRKMVLFVLRSKL